MGFDNESRIEEALVTANNDIDSAISILVNGILDTQSSEARLSDREESSSDADFSTSAADEFPVAEYSRLEASVFVEKWNIPCLRSQSFGICLQSSIRLVEKQGIVVFSKVEELKRFVTTCLDECLKKLLTSSAVLTWDAETLEGVHNMLELVVQLAAEFLKAVYVSLHSNDQRDSVVTTPSFNLPSGKTLIEAVCNAYDKPFEQTEANVHLTTVFMRYLNLIFDPECSYHQRCRDRATNTGTYIDEFNHWIPSPDIRQADAEVYAEVLPAPKNFYLVNLINCFGMCGGFPVLRWLSTRRFTSLDIHVTLLPLSNAADYLTTSCLLRYATWPMVRTLWKLNNLTAEDLKRQGVQVFEMTTCLRVLCYRITSLKLPASEACVAPITTEEVCTPCQPDWDQLMSRCQTDADLLATLKMLFSVPLIDELHLSLLLTSLCPPVGAVGGSFANRLLAISQLIDLLTAVQSSRSDRDRSDVRSVSSGGTSRRFTGSASLLAMENMAFLNRRKIHRLVRCETLMSWLKDKHVIQRLMTNLDNETYMSKIAELLRCLRERITLEDITVLWKCQEGQSAAAVTNILQLLADVGACCFSQPQLDHLFNLIRGNWLSLDLQVSIQFTRSRTNPTRQSIGEAGGGGGGGGSMRRRRASKCFPRHLPEPTTVRHARAGLLNLISTIGLNSREPWVSDQCLKLLWQLAHGLRPQDIATSLVSPTRSRQSADAGVPATATAAASSAVEEVEEATTAAAPPQQATPHHHRHSGRTKHALGKFIHGLGTTSVSVTLDSSVKQYVHPEPTEAALSQLLTVLRDSHLPAQEQRPRQASWLALAAEELKHGKLAFFLLSFVRTILELILKPLPGRTKKEHLRELNRNHSLIDTVCNSLHRYHKQAVSRHGQALSASSENEFGVPHGDLIKRHLSLLHYLLTVADVHLSLDRAQCIWETLTNDSHYSAYGLEECLSWFAGAIDLLEQDAQTAIFTKHFLKLDPTQLHSLTGFKCFETFFVRVNLNENRLKMRGDVWKVERMDLMGMDLLWDLYTSFPPAPQVTHSLTSPRDLGQANASLLGSGGGSAGAAATGIPAGSSGYAAKLVQSPATPCTRNDVVHGVNLRTAVLLSRQLLLDVSWCRLSQRLRREPDTCHKRFFDACRKRISANLSVMQDSKANSPNSLRTLLADTGQMLASLLVGPKAASTARTRHARCSKLALHRLLYLVHAYIQKSEDDLIGDRPPPPYWRPHYLTFRGWELRLPLHIYASNGQPIVLSNLPLSSDNLSAPFSLCLSDVAQQYQQNPILVMHSNATLGAVRDRAAIMASACVYARRTLLVSDSTASTGTLLLENPALLQFTYGLERLALGPTGALGAPRRLQNASNAPPPSGGGGSCQLSTTSATTETETPLGHNFDRKPIGEIGFQTGRPLIIRLQLADASVKEPCPTSGTSSGGSSVCNLDSVASAYTNSRSAMDVSASPRRSSGASIRSGASLSLSQRFSFGSSTAPPHPPQKVSSANPAVGGVNVTGGSQPLDSPLPLKPLALPSITLASGASVYDLLFELAEADLQELTAAAHEASRCGSASGGGGSSEDEPRQPSLLHLTRLLLYCLPTYNPATQTASSTWLGSHTATGLMPPSATAPGGGKAAVSPMICTPENVIKAPQFRLLYMLQVLSSELVTRETSAWWESVQAVAGANIGPSVTPGDLGGGGGHADSTSGLLEQPELIDLQQRSPSGIVKRSSFAFIESAAVGERVRPKLLISSESCLSMPTTLNGDLGPTSAPPSPGVERKRHNRFIGKFSLRWPGPGSASSGKSKQPPELAGMSTPVQSYDWLEPLVIVLRRQLAFMPSLTPSNLTGLVMPGLFPFSGPESSTRDSRCADWICREIKHLCLQILATLLNPAPRRNADSTLANSRSSSVSSVCSTLAMASSGFAAKFVSVVLDTALASADITDSARPDRVSTARGSLSGSSGRRRGPKLQHVESNAGVTNVLDPLAVTDVALTCQDVEIAVQSIRLLCQSVLSYPSYFMGAFMQLPQLGHSLLRLLLHSPSVRRVLIFSLNYPSCCCCCFCS
nr:unnamed protein product [Spirometra erinaceieuropaei]